MPRITCEYCERLLHAPMKLVGKDAPCPACGRMIRIMPGQLNLPTDVTRTWCPERMHMSGS